MTESNKSESNKKNKIKIGIYSAVIAFIVILSFIAGTMVGFYFNHQLDNEEVCEPIPCDDILSNPQDYDKCEICKTKSIIRIG